MSKETNHHKSYTLITGASSGIGKAFAEYYAKEKRNLILVARSTPKLLELKEKFEKEMGVSVLALTYDLALKESAKKIYEEVHGAGIFVETLVNNAGFATNGAVSQTPLANQRDEIMVNVLALFELSKLFLDEMVERDTGTIINIASSAAYHPIPAMAVYAATKAFVLSFTEALAVECQGTGVTVFASAPGATETNFVSNGGVLHGKIRTPEHVVETSIKASRRGRYSKIDGFDNYINSAILPRLLPRKVMVKLVGRIMVGVLDRYH